MKDGSMPGMYAGAPSLNNRPISGEDLGKFATIKIPPRSLEEALTALHRPLRGSKEVLPTDIKPEERVQYKDYYTLLLDAEMTIDQIETLIEEKGGLQHAGLLLFLSVQEERVAMGDDAPVVVFWNNGDLETGACWYHCLCSFDEQNGVRYVEYGPVREMYPIGTTVITVPILS